MEYPLILVIIAFTIVIVVLVIARTKDYLSDKFCKNRPYYKLDRHESNPVLSPQQIREWEHGGTFNPAAIMDDTGTVHLLYRAVGADGISRVGHASSPDGRNFDERSPYPVFEPYVGYGMPNPDKVTGPKRYCPEFYTSGGGWGGSEDPRAVVIDGRVYMTYVAFEGWNSVRIGLTSILLNDLKQKKWNWRRPVLISNPKEVNKNWLIFPEKINGRFAIIHSIVPQVLIEYVDSLDGITKPISSPRPQGVQPGRKNFWDNRVRGSGPPPIKTDIGWLLLYHAQDMREPNKYKLGAMILDLNDPTKVLYRSPQPILEPDAYYENDGKPGVVYASGAVIIGDDLMVYYGGGDKHVCIAQTPMKSLLEWLVTYGNIN
jgi:predicted GH43/DUF377 family glycosyl hydrolase